jgi:hypothetical protein
MASKWSSSAVEGWAGVFAAGFTGLCLLWEFVLFMIFAKGEVRRVGR